MPGHVTLAGRGRRTRGSPPSPPCACPPGLFVDRTCRRRVHLSHLTDPLLPSQGNFVACMTAILRQMEDYHYAHLIKTFGKMRTDVVVSSTGRSSPARVCGQRLRPSAGASDFTVGVVLMGNPTWEGLREAVSPRRQGSRRADSPRVLSGQVTSAGDAEKCLFRSGHASPSCALESLKVQRCYPCSVAHDSCPFSDGPFRAEHRAFSASRCPLSLITSHHGRSSAFLQIRL